MQTKRQSLIETVVSTLIGLAVSFLTQIIVFPMYNLEVNINQNLQITAIFTIVSILRGYCVRRLFNKKKL